jgi:pyruvate/2-oxoglutarate dehydrogenase complex dihydrolipoamide dehydrogenase (E3) component
MGLPQPRRDSASSQHELVGTTAAAPGVDETAPQAFQTDGQQRRQPMRPSGPQAFKRPLHQEQTEGPTGVAHPQTLAPATGRASATTDIRSSASTALWTPSSPKHARQQARGANTNAKSGLNLGPSASAPVVEQLADLEAAFRAGVPVGDRKHLIFTFKSCFVGSEAVDWLVATRRAGSREDAVRIGQAMVENGVFEHVRRDHPFRDANLFYEFVDCKKRGTVTRYDDGQPMRWVDFLDPITIAADSAAMADNSKHTKPTDAAALAIPPIPLCADVDTAAIPNSVHVVSKVWPLDEHNLALLDNVHPPSWIDPPGHGVYNLVVIGAGAGGLVTAAGAAGVGAKVALIEAHALGGDCLNVGCIPSKALLHAANLAHTLKDASYLAEAGVSIEGGSSAVKVDFGKTMERIRKIRAQVSHHDSADRFTKTLGVDVYFGYAKFASESTLVVNGRVLEFKRAVIATGGYPALVSMPGLAQLLHESSSSPSSSSQSSNSLKDRATGINRRPCVMTNETFFNLTTLPRRLGVIGPGVAGMELAQAMQRLGSQVTVFGRSSRVLSKEDEDLAEMVKAQLVADGVQFHLGITEFLSICVSGAASRSTSRTRTSTTVDMSESQEILGGQSAEEEGEEKEEEENDDDGSGDCVYPELVMHVKQKDGTMMAYKCDALLVTAGRRPNVTGLDLELARVRYDEVKGLVVNDHLQTTNPRIYGVGDCCDTAFKYTHAADFMARMVIRNALFFGSEKLSSLLIPRATYTTPELAHVGLQSTSTSTSKSTSSSSAAAATPPPTPPATSSPHHSHAHAHGHHYHGGGGFRTVQVPFSANDRATTDGDVRGVVRVHVDERSDAILGASIVGAGAGELISELTLAMQSGTGLGKLAAVIHPYPTRAEAIRHAGDAFNRGRLTPTVRGLLRNLMKVQR